MTAITILILATYVVIVLAIGFAATKKSSDTAEDYFVASRSLSWFHLGATLFATWMSTFAFIGSPGFYYKNGVSWYLPHGFLVVASPFLLWLIGRRIWARGRAHGYITPADLLADHYSSGLTRFLVAIVCLLALVPYCLVQLIGVGKVLEAATVGAIPYTWGVTAAVAAIAIYTYLGGIRAVVWTDAVQAICFGLLMVVGAAVAIYASGGLLTGIESAVDAQPDSFVFDTSKAGSPLSLLVMWTCGYILLPHMWQRAYMASSAKSLSRSIVMGAVLAFFVIAIPSLIIGCLGMGFLPGLQDSDAFVPTMYVNYLPMAVPFVVLATFAAGMSTVDSQLLSASSVVTQDLVRPLFGDKLTPSGARKVGRITSTCLLVFVMVIALSPWGQGNIIVLASKGTGIALLLLVPLLGALFTKEGDGSAVTASLILGSLTLLMLETRVLSLSIPYGFHPAIAAVAVQAIVFLAISASASPKAQAAS